MRSVPLSLAASLLAATCAAGQDAVVPTDVAVKAALLFNFAKFAEWPNLAGRSSIVACVVGDGRIADTLIGIVRGKFIGGHGLLVVRPTAAEAWHECHVLFIAGSEVRQSTTGLEGIRTLPVLSVSDGRGFSRSGGLIELFVEGSRMRFAINVDAVARTGLRLSSRLLGLATVVRDRDAP